MEEINASLTQGQVAVGDRVGLAPSALSRTLNCVIQNGLRFKLKSKNAPRWCFSNRSCFKGKHFLS